MSQTWVDYKTLREKLDFAQLLKDYGVELKPKKKDQLTGYCPLPDHDRGRDRRMKRSPSFSANLERKIFHCFGCGRGGNCLDFAILMEGKDPDRSEDVRAIAVKLAEKYDIVSDRQGNRSDAETKQQDRRPSSQEGTSKQEPLEKVEDTQPSPPKAPSGAPVMINAPLDFELKGLDSKHPYLFDRGFLEETIGHFGLGYCNRGLMQDRYVIPLHDEKKQLIGYAGRIVDDSKISPKCPKYLFPTSRLRNDTVLEFRKSFFLYNSHAISAPARDLIVVEGFPSVWWLTQCGFDNVVALMGSSCSDEQAVLLHSLVAISGRLWIFPDAGEAGERCAHSVIERLIAHRFCKWVRLDEGQPTDCSAEELAARLEWRAVP